MIIFNKKTPIGFGFNLAFVFLILPLSIFLVITWVHSQKKIFGKLLLFLWLGVIGIFALSFTVERIFAKKELVKADYYGDYIIDKNFFAGKQATWQYNHFRFTITEQDSIFFYVTEKEIILKTYKGKITTVKPHNSERLVIEMEKPTYHTLTNNPTTYREIGGFYLVFQSPKFHNMFFRKGKWKSD